MRQGKAAFFGAVLALASAVFFPGSLVAQIGGAGAIQGTVTDPSGGVVPNATVVGTNQATNVTTTIQTTDKGFYVLSPLQAGKYTVTVKRNGFKTYTQQDVTVNALTTAGLNIKLEVGTVTQQVTVTSAPPQLNTSNGTLGATIENSAYSALPLAVSNGPRNPQGFVTLLPGVTGAGGTLHVNGGQGYTGTIYINGSPDVYQELGNDNRGLTLGLSVDSINQFQLDTSGTPAMYEGQGVQNYVTKSGTNRFHGSAWEYLRNTDFDARCFFCSTRAVEHQNEFGGDLGGPIVHNKIFFFADYDGFREHTGTNPRYISIPTAAERTGDFSALLGPQLSTCTVGGVKNKPCYDALGRPIYQGEIFDPSTTRTVGGAEIRNGFGFDSITGQPIPGQANVIPSGDISAISQSLASYLPATVNNDVANNFLESFPNPRTDNELTARGDFILSQRNRMWAVMDWGRLIYTGTPANNMPLPYAEERQVTEEPWLGQLGDTFIISPTLVNQLNLSYNRIAIPITNLTVGGHYATKSGIKGLPPGQASNAFPRVTFGGPNSPTNWGGNGAEAFDEYDNEWDISETAELVYGAHNLSFGADLAKQSDIFFSPDQGSFPAVFSFGNNQTAGFDSKGNLLTAVGNSYASYLLGDLSGGSIGYNAAAEVDSISFRYGPFIEDDWRVTPHLTMNLGLRWDVFTPFVERYNRFTFMSATAINPVVGIPGVLQYAGSGSFGCGCRTPVQTHYHEFAPRFGFAYQFMKDTVLRASWGMFYDRAGALGGGIDTQAANLGALGYSNGPIISTPNSYTPALSAWNGGTIPSFQQPPIFDNTLNTGYTTATGPKAGGMTYPDPQLGGHPVETESYNFGIERALTPSMVLGVYYSGSQGHFIPTTGRGYYLDQILPKYLVLGSLLNATATTANIAKANAILASSGIPNVGLPYATFDGSIGQMLRPFPQYSGVGDPYGDVGNETYNSLQVMLQHTMSRGLQFLVSYTFSKDLGNGGSIKGGKGAGLGSARTGYNLDQEKSICNCDVPQALVVSEVWQLPIGTGHSLFNGNRVERAIASGWEVSGIESYYKGGPLGAFGAACNLPYAGTCYADYNPSFSGAVRINGSYGSGTDPAATPYLDVGAFQSPAPYTFGNTPRSAAFDLWGPGSLNEDLALRRNFKIHENWTLLLSGEAYNSFNRVNFGGPNTSITSKGFGTVGSAGGGRILQVVARLNF